MPSFKHNKFMYIGKEISSLRVSKLSVCVLKPFDCYTYINLLGAH